MEKQTITTVTTATATGDEPEICISTISLDRDNDEVVPEGADLDDYRKNPVVLYGHDYSAIPVGTTTSISVDPGRGIRARWRWLQGDPFADRVRNAFEQGILRAASIGFMPTSATPNGKGGVRFTAWTLLEWSIVPVPANPAAVRALKSLNLWRDDEQLLTLDDEHDVLAISDWTPKDARRLRSRAAMRRSEPFEPVIDIDPAQLRGVLASVVADAVARQRAELVRTVREQTAAAINRARGRVD